jgi:hypothetical protein
MGLLSRFRSNAPAQTVHFPVSKPAALWRRGDFVAVSVGAEFQTVYPRGGTPFILPSFAVEFAQGCHRFRPLNDHLGEHAENHGWHSQQMQALSEWLPRLIEAGALVSSEQVRAMCSANAASDSNERIESIGFPTGGQRVPLLERALRSFAENAQRHGRAPDFVVADSSTQAEHRGLYRDMLSELSGSLGVRILYSGEEERLEYCEALIRKGCRRDAVEFGLLDPLGTGFACGANRNTLLLQGAGRMLCSIDDDVVCRLAAPPEARAARLALFSHCDPFARWPFASAEEARETVTFSDHDFLAAHETLLGRSIASLIPYDGELDLTDLDDEFLRRLALGGGRVRTSFFGHVGDPGIPTSCYYLFYQGENRRRLTPSEKHFRGALTSRSLLALVPGPAIGDASISPGMAMGLDHRELLPPFPPVLHAEDFVFGAAVWQCCPGAFSGQVPLAVHHDPPPGKPILTPADLGPDRRIVLFEFAQLLRRAVLDFEPAPRASTAERMRALGRSLATIAAMPLEDFCEIMREKTLAGESERLAYLENRLEQEADLPAFWREEVERFMDNTRESLTCPDFDIPYDLKGGRTPDQSRRFMQQLFAGYGGLLQEWPGMVQAAVELQTTGVCPAHEIGPRR